MVEVIKAIQSMSKDELATVDHEVRVALMEMEYIK